MGGLSLFNTLDGINGILINSCKFNCAGSRHGILGHLGVECTSGGTTIPLNLIETEQELKGSLK